MKAGVIEQPKPDMPVQPDKPEVKPIVPENPGVPDKPEVKPTQDPIPKTPVEVPERKDA